MNVTIGSCFVNSMAYLPRYLAQVLALGDALQARGDHLFCLWGEGDSADDTLRILQAAATRFDAEIVDVTHGGPIFGSVAAPERFRQLAGIGRNLYARIPADCDVFLWVESDLIWDTLTAISLIDLLAFDEQAAAMAPAVLLRRSGWPREAFYDTHAFRAGGKQFMHLPPYHPANTGWGAVEMDSVGSFAAFDAFYIRRVTMDERVIMGVCEDIRGLGGRVWFLPWLTVVHE